MGIRSTFYLEYLLSVKINVVNYRGLWIKAVYGATVEHVKNNMGISPRENLFETTITTKKKNTHA